MPTLPGFDSSQNINTQPAGVERNIAAQPFQDVQNMVGTLDTITQKLSDANDVMQVTKAETTHTVALAQAQKAAQLDPNPDNAEAHIKAINDLTNTAVDGIDNQQVAKQLAPKLQQQSFLAQIQIQDDFKKKQMLTNDIALGSFADVSAQNRSNAITPAAGQQIDQDFISSVNRNYAAGLITEGRAKGLIDDYRMGIVKNDILKENATEIGDSKVLAEVNKGVGGNYPNLSTDQRTEADRMVRLQVRDNKNINTQQSMSTRIDTIKSIASGDLTWQNTNFISNIAQKDPNLAEALQKNFNKNKAGDTYVAEDDKNSDFESLVGDIFKANTKEDINKFLVKSLVPGMSMDRLSILVNAAEQRGAKLPTSDGAKDGQIDPKQEQIDNSVKHLQDYANANKPTNVLLNFFKGLGGGAQPIDSAQKSMNMDALEKRPDLIGNPPRGKTMIDKYGNRAVVYPDGHFEDIKEHKSE